MKSITRESWGIVGTSDYDVVSLLLNNAHVVNTCRLTGHVTNVYGCRFTLVNYLLLVQIRRQDRWEALWMFKLSKDMAADLFKSFVHLNVQKRPTCSR